MGKTLKCIGTMERMKCKLDEQEYSTLPSPNVKFDVTTINNVSKVENTQKKGTMYVAIAIEADKESEIICNEDFGKYGLELRCKAIGKRTASFPEIWEEIADLDNMKELEGDAAKKANKILENILEQSFPEVKDKIDYLKIFVVPKLEKYGVSAVTKSWIEEEDDGYQIYPIYIGFASYINNIHEDEYAKKLFELDLIHELTHVARELEERYKFDVGEEEGETYTEALARGDWKVRVRYPFPHGEVEEVIYAKRCILPKQYCFESLKDAREFEEFNYELVTGEEEPKPITPKSLKWSEIEKRIPVAPIVDMIRGMKGSYNVLTDVHEYWMVVTSPSGKDYLYHVADLHVDHKQLDFIKAVETIDNLDGLLGNEDIEEVWDYP